MKRRTLLAGAAGLVIANKAGAIPQGNVATQPAKTNKLVEVSIEAVYDFPEPEMEDSRVVLLKDKKEERYLPIWIGKSEGISIYSYLQGAKSSRPLSHDFMANVVKGLGADVESVAITLQDRTFYAVTTVVGNGKTAKVDGRPSDAIALAVRFDAPVFVVSDLLKPSTLEQVSADIREQAANQAKEMDGQAKPQP